MTADSREQRAREELLKMIENGNAVAILETYDDHHLSCGYVYGLINEVAENGSSMTAQEFARALQEAREK